ncbi:non-ribosomal peptide synthetase [Catenulispora subtropica]|uniref:Amino acid adenylation domain protein n=1 Tax=Catenulispora subtropica TaxID=450798 RepID=A0ABN2SM54_9ACTN
MDEPCHVSNTLLNRFLIQVACQPHAPAVREGGRTLTYAQVSAAAAVRAERLANSGVGSGDRVAVILSRCADAVTYYLAAMACGAAYVHIDPADPPGRRRLLVELCRPAAVVVAADAEGVTEGLAVYVDVPGETDHLSPSCLSGIDRARASGADDVAYAAFTSGSTGMPKAVEVTHTAILNLLDAVDERAGRPRPLVSSWWTSPRFDVSVWEVWSAIAGGSCVAVVPDRARLDADAFLDHLAQVGVTSAFVPAAFVGTLADRAVDGLVFPEGLRRALVGVEPIDGRLLASLVKARPQLAVINGYGPTEATVCCSLFLVTAAWSPDPGERTPIGTAIAGSELLVVDEDDLPVADGVAGELVVVGRGVARGYLNGELGGFTEWAGRPAYRTGDVVVRDPDGNLMFVGRRDRQIKIRGYRLEPAEVETTLHRVAGLTGAHVMAVADPTGTVLVAFVVPAAQFDEASVREALADRLPPYAIPARIITLTDMPQTDAGKIDEEGLRRTALAHLASRRTGQLPRPGEGIAQIITRHWCDVLGPGHDGLGFVAAGGTSLDAMKLASLIRAETRLSITAADVLSAAGVDDLVGLRMADVPAHYTKPGAMRSTLHPGQMGIWAHEQITGDRGMYLEVVCFALPSDVNRERLVASLHAAAAAHPVFGARLEMGEAGPDIILAAHPVPILPMTGRTLRTSIDEVKLRLAAPGAPLCEMRIVDCAAEGLFLVLAWHHLVVDDVSVELFLADVESAFAGATPDTAAGYGGRTFCDLAVDLTVADRTAESAAAARSFATELAEGGLPTMWGPDVDDVGSHHRALLDIPAADHHRQTAWWRREGVTDVAMYAAVLAIILDQCWPGQAPIIGLPRSRRLGPEDFRVSGYGIDTALLRLHVGDPGDVLATARDAMRWLGRWLGPSAPSLRSVVRHLRATATTDRQPPDAMLAVGRLPVLRLGSEVFPPLVDPAPVPKFPVVLDVRQSAAGGGVHLDLQAQAGHVTGIQFSTMISGLTTLLSSQESARDVQVITHRR